MADDNVVTYFNHARSQQIAGEKSKRARKKTNDKVISQLKAGTLRPPGK